MRAVHVEFDNMIEWDADKLLVQMFADKFSSYSRFTLSIRFFLAIHCTTLHTFESTQTALCVYILDLFDFFGFI